MYVTEQYYMYRLAYDFVMEDKYEMLYMNPKTNELWLEKNGGNVSTIIRFIHKGFDWKNHLKTDIAQVFQRVKAMRKYFLGKHVEIFNVYVTSHEPVDDWEILKKPMQLKEKNPLKMKVFYFTKENYNDEKGRLLQQVNSNIQSEVSIPSVAEQENKAVRYKLTLSKLLQDKNKRVEGVFTYGKPRYTYLLIAINIVMFFLLEMNGGSMNIENLIESGAKYNPAIIDGEWWRIISSMFLHIGIFHLFMNMLALYYLGVVVEKIYGSARFLMIYFLAGIGGGLTSFAFNIHVSAGASGALFGLFGALLFFGTMYKRLFSQTMGKSLIVILVINVIFGFMVQQIDMGAHIGGLIMGFLASGIVSVPKKKNRLVQIGSIITYIIIIVFLIRYGVT